MSTTYSSSIGLGIPALNDRNWHTPLNASLNLLDALSPIGGLCVQAKEHPSTTLNVKVSAGKFRKQDGTVGTYAGTAGQAITLSTTKVLYLDNSGTLTVAASYPTTAHVRLATVVAGATAITSVTDDRVCVGVLGTDAFAYLALAGGTMTDGANIAVGSTTGTKIGTATTQKLGFYNATPVVQAASTTDLRTVLINVGLLASGGATPLNLNGGALTAATIATGTVTMTDATNFVVGSTTGTQVGTATTQKLGFYGATPVVQPTGTTDIRTALINLGLYATGGASPLNLNGGAFTAATIATGTITMTDATNIAVGTTTGTKIGTATTQKLGFYNATPVVQPSGAGQAAVTQTQTTLTDSTGGVVSTTLAAITAGAAYAQADMTATKNAIASLAAELALVKTDEANTLTLLNKLRADLVALGLIKGSA